MKKSSKYFFVLIIFFLLKAECVFAEKLYYAAPTVLPYTTPEMKTAGFWISRHLYPDKVILTPEEIVNFNLDIREKLKLAKDLTKLSAPFSGKELIMPLEMTLSEFANKNLYDENGKKVKPAFLNEMKSNMNFNAIPQEVTPQFGFIVRFADQRFFPTKKGLYTTPGDIDFDELQNSDLDSGTPVIVLHKSLNGQWYYVESEISFGWVEAKKVVVGSAQDMRDFIENQSFVVTVKPKTDIFLNSDLTEHYDYVRMGMKFPIAKFDSKTIQIKIPLRDDDGTLIFKTGHVKREDIHEGYLPYTARHIINQAFELINSPYGWGGLHGEQDCSRFLQEIFATVGVSLPRDSKDQAKVGRVLVKFKDSTSEEEKFNVLKNDAVGGITILPLRGHIMLFLGTVDNRPYAIHATWGYREKMGSEDIVRVVNRVCVSDLSLGKGSKKGSLLRRLSSVVTITK